MLYINYVDFVLNSYHNLLLHFRIYKLDQTFRGELAALDQIVACLPLIQQVRGPIPGGGVNFHLKVFNLGARRGGDVHFLIARLYITHLD